MNARIRLARTAYSAARQIPALSCFALLWLTASASCSPSAADDLPGLHNLQRASDTVLSGSEPEGEAAFAALQKQGITTIVSVDGAVPNAALAEKFGMRYIHIPLGYDGIDPQTLLALVRVGREIKTPLYVHCHHGRHRGPAAVGVICQAAGQMTPEQATALLKRCGTSPDYKGLWRDVAAFRSPDPGTPLPELRPRAQVDSLAAAMARLDRHFDNVKLAAAANWKTPAEHPDLVPRTETLLLQEGLSESLRLLTSDRPAHLRNLMQESTALSVQLLQAVRANRTAEADKFLQTLTGSCTKCHQEFRN